MPISRARACISVGPVADPHSAPPGPRLRHAKSGSSVQSIAETSIVVLFRHDLAQFAGPEPTDAELLFEKRGKRRIGFHHRRRPATREPCRRSLMRYPFLRSFSKPSFSSRLNLLRPDRNNIAFDLFIVLAYGKHHARGFGDIGLQFLGGELFVIARITGNNDGCLRFCGIDYRKGPCRFSVYRAVHTLYRTRRSGGR